jgi:hypothetical protein
MPRRFRPVAGASWRSASTYFLMPCQLKGFLPKLVLVADRSEYRRTAEPAVQPFNNTRRRRRVCWHVARSRPIGRSPEANLTALVFIYSRQKGGHFSRQFPG